MRQLRTFIIAVIILGACACSTKQADMYVHCHEGAKIDIFYICSTETNEWINEHGDTMFFADMQKAEHRAALYGEMRGVDSLLNETNDGNDEKMAFNFYAPYYNQATIEGLLRDTSLFRERCAVAARVVEEAFDDYIAHYNEGRPFVLMGYSQGGFAVVDILKRLTAEQAERMIAAYVIGYEVTQEDLRYPYIRAAEGEADTGVTICFNSVASNKAKLDILSGRTAIGINPVNWCTDATPAQYLFDFGGASKTLTVHLDTTTHLTIIEGYDGACPNLPFIGKEGNYHCLEIPLYYRVLRKNIEARYTMKN